MSNRGILSAVTAAASALALAVLLGGCSEGPAPAHVAAGVSPSATAPTATTPTVESSSAPQPLDAQSAWNACAAVAQEQYVAKNEGSAIVPFSSSTTLQTDGDGATFVVASVTPARPIEGVKSIAFICTMSGTADAPQIVKWIMKDI
jgi:hypothetical protein